MLLLKTSQENYIFLFFLIFVNFISWHYDPLDLVKNVVLVSEAFSSVAGFAASQEVVTRH